MVGKQTGRSLVQKRRDGWVVRVEGIDMVSGAREPRQLGHVAIEVPDGTAVVVHVAELLTALGRQ